MDGLALNVAGAAGFSSLRVHEAQARGSVLRHAAPDEGPQPEAPPEGEADAELEVHPLEAARVSGDGAAGAADAEVEPLVAHAKAHPRVHRAIRSEVPEHLEAEANVARRARGSGLQRVAGLPEPVGDVPADEGRADARAQPELERDRPGNEVRQAGPV